MRSVKIGEDEFYTEIDWQIKQNRKKSRKATNFTSCVYASVKKIIKTLQNSEDYVAIFLTDNEMSID